MGDLNSYSMYGHVTKDGELIPLKTGIKVLRFNIAVNRSVKISNNTYEKRVSFFPIVVYGEYGERMLNHIRKGIGVIVHGSLRNDRWEKEGKLYSKITLIAKNIQIVNYPNRTGQGGNKSAVEEGNSQGKEGNSEEDGEGDAGESEELANYIGEEESEADNSFTEENLIPFEYN